MRGIAAALAVAFTLTSGLPASGAELTLIDDFAGQNSALGTRWEGFTDQVMGGKSVIRTGVERRGGESFLYLRTTRTVFLPFADFKSENMASSRLEPGKLVSLAIVAAKREFEAELEVDSVFWYR